MAGNDDTAVDKEWRASGVDNRDMSDDQRLLRGFGGGLGVKDGVKRNDK
jgi:hypothetical protein